MYHQKPAPPKKFRKLTMDMVLAATSLTRSSKESSEAYLQRVTHLHLQNKKLRVIEGLDLCTNLKVLYLYDNQIERIENLNFATILQYLYLRNNMIKDIPQLQMPNLKKLFLDDNEIKFVTGLTECAKLEELHLSRQRLPTFTSLQFDRDSLNAISRTLEVLEISGCAISILSSFTVLFNLRKFLCQDNAIVDISEIERIVALPRLEDANFIGNPCCQFFKYRDILIGAASDAIQMLDEQPVLRHQQIAIRGLMEHRRKIGAIEFRAGTNQRGGQDPMMSGGDYYDGGGAPDEYDSQGGYDG